MIMQVHDELVFEMSEAEWVRGEVPRLMAQVADLKVVLRPISASGSTGKRRTERGKLQAWRRIP